MAPDAIPVHPQASVATLPPEAITTLFGPNAGLRLGAEVALVHLGEICARVAVQTGAALAVELDAIDARSMGPRTGLRLRGPVGVLDAPPHQTLRSVLRIPGGLKAAWRMGDTATLGLGSLAVQVPVETGDALTLHAERALWLAAGAPSIARWLPQTTWPTAPTPEPASDPRIARVAGRVITENDVRQARLRQQRIQLAAEQIVTPAARSLAREWDVFVESTRPPTGRD